MSVATLYSSGQWSYACRSLLFCVCWVWYYTYSVEYYSFTYAMLLVCSIVPCPAVSRIFYGIWMLHSLRIFLSFCKYVALRVWKTLYWYYCLLCLSMVLPVSLSLCGCCCFHRPSGLSIDNYCGWSGPVLFNGGMILWSFHCSALLLLCCYAIYSCWCILKMLVFNSCNCENYSYVYFLANKSWDFLKMHWTKTISTQLEVLLSDLL